MFRIASRPAVWTNCISFPMPIHQLNPSRALFSLLILLQTRIRPLSESWWANRLVASLVIYPVSYRIVGSLPISSATLSTVDSLTKLIQDIKASRIAFRRVLCPTAHPFGLIRRNARKVSRRLHPSLYCQLQIPTSSFSSLQYSLRCATLVSEVIPYASYYSYWYDWSHVCCSSLW